MQRLKFGVTIPQAVPFDFVRDDVLFAERLGIDNAWLVDDFEVHGVPELSMREAWTCMAGLATTTSRIRLGTMVTAIGFRSPVMLAKQVLTIDDVSGGRVDLAVGSGYWASDHAAYGADFLDAAGRRSRLAEGVVVLDLALRGETVTFAGEHFRISEARCRPIAVQRPRPPIWVAAQTEGSLEIAARHADVAVCLGPLAGGASEPLDAFRARMALLDRLCERHGRDPASLRRCYFAGFADERIFASDDATATFIGEYADAGATDVTFYLANEHAPQLHGLVAEHRMATHETFARVATEVLPAFRA
jgi:alkanesulfonate monooxygenase SsuD/methylene tetrahydromethanopterin reductase-like flavin-dependent oxidoreductase (luciferase family)